jgi:phosphate transport system substrate-binding protein
MATMVRNTPNSIGYVELVYAIRQQLDYGAVRNVAGVFVVANIDSVEEAAVQGAEGTPELPGSITNAPGKGSYPIATFTWIFVPRRIEDPAKKRALLDLLRWMLTDGQKECPSLAYSPLPEAIVEKQLELVQSMK